MISRRSAFAAATLVAGAATLATRATGAAETKPHRVALHVDDNDAARMNLALNNATNVIEYYAQRGQTVTNKFYFTSDPGLDERDQIVISDGNVYDVISAPEPDASAGLGVVWRVMARRSTTVP